MNWYIGQEIVCVKTHVERVVVRGRTYTIKSLREGVCPCDAGILIDVGVPHDPSRFTEYSRCSKCGHRYYSGSTFWLVERHFAPLDQDISELTEILEKENVVKI